MNFALVAPAGTESDAGGSTELEVLELGSQSCGASAAFDAQWIGGLV